MITIPTQIQQAIVDSGVDPGASINVISSRVVEEHNLVTQPALPVKIRQALDPNGTVHNTKVVYGSSPYGVLE